MAKKKSKKKGNDFYSEGVNFSDDPEDSFYATEEEDDITTIKKSSSKTFFGFLPWEILVLIIELALVIYLVLVLLAKVPLL